MTKGQKIAAGLRKAWASGKFRNVKFGGGWPIGKKHSEETKRKCAEASKRVHRPSPMKGKKTGRSGCASTPEIEAERRRKISEYAKANGSGGYKPGSGRSKKYWHESPIAGRVFLQSSYELRYAKHLDASGVKWERNIRAFDYEFNGTPSRYVPDFRLIDVDEYVETKGFATERDAAKWRAFPGKLKILFGRDLDALGC